MWLLWHICNLLLPFQLCMLCVAISKVKHLDKESRTVISEELTQIASSIFVKDDAEFY